MLKKSYIFQSFKGKFIYHLAFILAVGLGIYVRFKGLGSSPFAEDEYYLAKSIHNLLEQGVPRFACGGYYMRGLIYQYIGSVFIYFFGHHEFFLRMIAVMGNLACIPVIYLLSKKISGYKVACITSILFCFSLWEIEFARFARMYSLFQAIFLWYLFFLYRIVIEDKKNDFKWLVILSLVGLFTYEASGFLLIINFFPLLLKHKLFRPKYILSIFFLFIAGYLFLTADFKNVGGQNYLPEGLNSISASVTPHRTTVILIKSLVDEPTSALIFSILASFLLYAAYRIWRDPDIQRLTKFSLACLLVLCVLNMYGFIFIALIVFWLLRLLNWHVIRRNSLMVFGAAIMLIFVFWLSYIFTKNSAISYFGYDHDSRLRTAAVFLFKYPNIPYNIIYPWLRAVPMLTICLTVVILTGFLKKNFAMDLNKESYDFLLAIVLIFFSLLGLTSLTYQMTRYTFFLYPVLLLLVTESLFSISTLKLLRWLNRNFVFIFFVALFAIITEDFSYVHTVGIDSRKYIYRIGFDYHLAEHYYFRMDYREAANTVNQNKNSDEIVITDMIPVDYYLNRLDYVYIDVNDWEFNRLAACLGKREIWTNAQLIHNLVALDEILKKRETPVWIIGSSDNERNETFRSLMSRMIASEYKDSLYYQSVDGKLVVYKIEF